MRIAFFAIGVALFLDIGVASAKAPPVPAPPKTGSAVDTTASEPVQSGIVVNGFRVVGVTEHADMGITPASMQAIADAAYRDLAAKAAQPVKLSYAQLQAVAARITAAYRKAGFTDARALLPGQSIGADHIVEIKVQEGATMPTVVVGAQSPDVVAGIQIGNKDETPDTLNVVPMVSKRSTSTQKIVVNGFRVRGVGNHPDQSVTPVSIQAVAAADYHQLATGAGTPVKLTFAQMQAVASTITDYYRRHGFIVAQAFIPAQTVGKDGIVVLSVLEGRIGKVIVKGAKRYRPWVIAAPAEKLKGKPLLGSSVETALLYARDLPGLSVASTFQPGEKTGDTDLLMIAHEARRPYEITLGGNNYGTTLTGRYRGEAGLTWNNALGIGDVFNGNVEYAFDPSNNIYGAVSYSVPTVVVPGLSGIIGATRNELQINTGSFAALDVKGPSASYYGGADWKFVNNAEWVAQTSLHFIYEQSKLSSLGVALTNERFSVAELTFALNRTDRRFHGVDLIAASLRKSISDNSQSPDLVSPVHSNTFLLGKLSYTRLQFLTKSQRLYLKLVGQYTNDALVPLEQFLIGGPDSVRAYPIADALRDRGYYASLEYHVDAPGFGDVISPFYGRPWRELLEFETFVDFAKGYSAGANENLNPKSSSLSGAGAGFIFRLPRFYHFEFHLDGAVPISSQDASDGNDYHIYGRFSFRY